MTFFQSMISTLSPLSWFFLFAFSLNGFVAIIILIFKNKTLGVAHFLLALNMLGISMGAIMMTVVQSGWIVKIPNFYRVPSPLYYMMFPAAYLYVRLIFTDKIRLVWTDYLHFLPALLHLIELIPFYSLSIEEKLKYINMATGQTVEQWALYEGWLPAFAHNIIRGIQSLIYSIAMWRLIRKSSLATTANRYSATVMQWLKTFTLLNGIIGLVAVVFLSITLFPTEVRSFALQVAFLIALLILNYYLFLKPEILYGLPQPVLVDQSNSIAVLPSVNNVIATIPYANEGKADIPNFIHQYKNQVHHYLIESQRFLEPDFMLQDLSRDTGIPIHHLQLLIHKVEAKKFSEFINGYRIQHLKDQIGKGSMKNKTLEGLATESGFSSKATFIRSVKKSTGKTPKDYFSQSNSLV